MNPSNNYTMLAFIIVVTLGLFLLLRKLYKTKYAWTIKVLVICLLLSNFFIYNILNITTGYYNQNIIYANGPNTLDNFHSGEQLAPANAFLNGSQPYGDMFFLRGLGVDVIIPALGFLIFGKSIGSFLLITHLLMLLAMLGFFLLIWLVFKGVFKYILAIILFYIVNSISLVQTRDIPVWIVIGLVIHYFKPTLCEKHKKSPYFLSEAYQV